MGGHHNTCRHVHTNSPRFALLDRPRCEAASYRHGLETNLHHSYCHASSGPRPRAIRQGIECLQDPTCQGQRCRWTRPKVQRTSATQVSQEADIANELKSYETQTVDIEGQAEGGAVEQEVDWFEQEPEEEEAHH